MKPKHAYVILAFLGVVLPYLQFVPWVRDNGLEISLLVDEIAASRLEAFGWLDVIMSSLALLVFMIAGERRKKVAGSWLPILGTLAVGVSPGLPLDLLLRKISREAAT